MSHLHNNLIILWVDICNPCSEFEVIQSSVNVSVIKYIFLGICINFISCSSHLCHFIVV
jgi:hypothetical protein